MNSGVYTITHSESGKQYVGSTMNFPKRFSAHRKDLSMGRHHCHQLQHAWNKYGAGSFRFEKLLFCAREHLLLYEQRALDVLNPVYNECRIAASCLGVKHSPATRAKVSAALRGHPVSKETREAISCSKLGKKHSPAHCAAISAAQLGKARPSPSVETRVKLRTALLGHDVSPEAIEKMRCVKLGKRPSEATRQKMGAAHRGHAVSEATRQKIRDGQLQSWRSGKRIGHLTITQEAA